MGTGTFVDPFTLAEAMSSEKIAGGDTVYLREGIYTLTEDTNWYLSGIAGRPINIRPYANEQVAIDIGTFDLHIYGAYLNFYDLRIFSSDTQGRISVEYTAGPSDIYLGDFGIFGNEINLFGCVIHDVANVGQSDNGPGGHWADCVIYNCGWAPPAGYGPWGHSLYSQNLTSTRYFTQCLWGSSYGTVGVRGSTAANLYHYRFYQNVGLHCDLRLGGYGATIYDAQFADSVLLNSVVHLGYSATANDLTFINNFIDTWDHLRTYELDGFTFTGNTWIQVAGQLLETLGDNGNLGVLDYNIYYGPNEARRVDITEYASLAEFQAATGQEAHSTRTAEYPVAQTWVFACTHSLRKKALLAFYDYAEPATVIFDVSSLSLVTGASYRLRSGYDYLGDTQDIEYDGSGAIAISTAGRTVAVPNGAAAALVEVSPVVGAWVLEAI